MNDNNIPKGQTQLKANELRQLTDKFILLANELSEDIEQEYVSSSLVYAAARFNAYLVAINADGAKEMADHRPKAVKYFSDQYLRMFNENLDDYENNYSSYLGKTN